MISCTVEDPDGGGGGNGGGGNGTGKNEVASGRLWWNLPSSFDITKLEITSIAYDPSVSVGGDAIRIVVKDNDGDWWKVVVDFKETPSGTSNYDPPRTACYQYANIYDTNTLVTYLDSGSASKHTALIFYELDIDDV